MIRLLAKVFFHKKLIDEILFLACKITVNTKNIFVKINRQSHQPTCKRFYTLIFNPF